MILNYKKRLSVNELYNAAEENNTTLFPTADYDFWAGYTANASKFDMYFEHRFSDWRYFKKFDTTITDNEILAKWKIAVDNFLFINSKKYSELYRVQVLASNAYDIVNNYDLTEEVQRSGESSGSENLGTKSNSYTQGATGETNTHSYEAHTDTASATLGSQTSTSESGISGFNSSDYVDDTNGTITNGSRDDSSSTSYGAHTDTDTISKQAQTNSETLGAQENTTSGTTSEESTLHRYGNIGVQTAAQIIGGHIELWDGFSFYNMIFDDIATNFLKIIEKIEVSYGDYII